MKNLYIIIGVDANYFPSALLATFDKDRADRLYKFVNTQNDTPDPAYRNVSYDVLEIEVSDETWIAS